MPIFPVNASRNVAAVDVGAAVGPLTSRFGFVLDANGRLVTTNDTGGTMVRGFRRAADGTLAVTDVSFAAAPVRMVNGFMRDVNGQVVAVASGAAVAPLVCRHGMNFDANGSLVLN